MKAIYRAFTTLLSWVGPFLFLASSQEQPQWRKKVEVFIRNDALGPTVVGIERE